MKVDVAIPIQTSWLEQAEDFAHASIESRAAKIKSRGQAGVEKIIKDIMDGALAELAVKQWWQDKYKARLQGPDFNVYTARKKSWAPDLVYEEPEVGREEKMLTVMNLHVKSFSNPKWNSWVFTCNPERQDIDPVVSNPQANDFLALTQVDHRHAYGSAHGSVIIHYFIEATKVRDLYKAPLLPQLAFSKLCLYPLDIDKLLTGF